MCKKCKQAYYAESHEYPCPWCIIEKKLDVIDRAHKELEIALIHNDIISYVYAMQRAQLILEEQKEDKNETK